jgi:hypothetical protein
MNTFISALSLLVLATGCFTLPVVREEFSSSTFPLLNDFTTSKTNGDEMASFHMRLIPDEETSDAPDLHRKRSFTDEFNTESSTFTNIPRFNKIDSKPSTFITGHEHEHSFHVRDGSDFLFNNVESHTEVTEHERRDVTTMENESEPEDAGEPEKRDFFESTTSYMPSFTSTSSDVAPQLYTSESSTEKYIGHLKDEQEGEKEIESKKPKTEDHSEEDSKELIFPTAKLVPKEFDQVYGPNYVMHLEKNNEVVTNIPETFPTTTMTDKKEQEPEVKPEPEPEPVRKHEKKREHVHESEPDQLNQGQESSLPEETKPDF